MARVDEETLAYLVRASGRAALPHTTHALPCDRSCLPIQLAASCPEFIMYAAALFPQECNYLWTIGKNRDDVRIWDVLNTFPFPYCRCIIQRKERITHVHFRNR